MKYIGLTIFLIFFLKFSWCQNSSTGYRNFVFKGSNQTSNRGLALVLANGNYTYGNPTPKALEGGEKIENVFKALGLDYIDGYDQSRAQTTLLIDSVRRLMPRYAYLVVYFAGHGFQYRGNNFLMPADAHIATEMDIDGTCINVTSLLAAIELPQKPKLLILDACREKLIIDSARRNMRSPGVRGSGLAEIKATANTLLIFSTAPGTEVPDENPFTPIFANVLNNGGRIEDIIMKTANEVEKIDPNQQVWIQGTLRSVVEFSRSNRTGPIQSNDRDGDGILDRIDKCPDQPGTVEFGGCPPQSNTQVINFLSDADGILYVNGNRMGDLRANKPLRLNLERGEYNISIISSASQLDVFTERLVISTMGDEIIKSINLNALSANRKARAALLVREGKKYENADGVARDYKRAVDLYLQSAALGDDDAMNYVGLLYNNGLGVAQDFRKALEWYRKAADRGNSAAMYNLGYIILYSGEWQSARLRDRTEALEWFKKSCDGGYEKGCELLKKLK